MDTELDKYFSDSVCRTILKNYLKNSNNNNGAIFLWRKFESLSGSVEGYLAEHFCLKITYQNDVRTMNAKFFVKTVLKGKGFLALFANAMDAFRKETFVYRKLFHYLQTTYAGMWVNIAPECYFAEDNFIVLEDLSQSGYKLIERLKFYNFEECKWALKTLAKYHAYSIIFEELKSKASGEKFRLNEAYPTELMDRFYGTTDENSPTVKFLEASIKTLIDLIDELDDQCNKEEFSKLLIATVNDDETERTKIPPGKYRMTCTHGDLWSTNIMFKYNNETDNKIIDCKIIDYQMLNYAMPAYDVELFLHGNTTSEFRTQHKGELVRYYYDSFAEILKQYNISDPEGILSFKDLLDTCILRGPEAKIQAISDKSLLYLPEEILQQTAHTDSDFIKTVLIDERAKYILEVYRTNIEFRQMIQMELHDLYLILKQRQQFLINI